jgi:hypothetical protein
MPYQGIRAQKEEAGRLQRDNSRKPPTAVGVDSFVHCAFIIQTFLPIMAQRAEFVQVMMTLIFKTRNPCKH